MQRTIMHYTTIRRFYISAFILLVTISGCARQGTDESNFGLVIHGGVGTIKRDRMTPEMEKAYRAKLNEALQAGYEILASGGTALNAVETAIIIMEDSPLFNAGKGAVFSAAGLNEMDASIMDGSTLAASLGLITLLVTKTSNTLTQPSLIKPRKYCLSNISLSILK